MDLPFSEPVRTSGAVRAAVTRIDDPELAVQHICRVLDPLSLAGMILFCSSRYDLDRLADALSRREGRLTIVGCTSSGELTPSGIAEGTITAIGFPASDFMLEAARFDVLDAFDPVQAQRVVRDLIANSIESARGLGPRVTRAAIFLVDGLSHREEMLTATLQDALGEIPLIGGSSGDGFAFCETSIFHEGKFRRDAAIVAILSSSRPMQIFRNQHHVPGAEKMVITGADPVARVVTEINAEPAAEEYARLTGVRAEDLGPSIFAARPLMVRAGGEYYARSIQTANADGSLTFYCAIDEGLVLTLGEGRDIVAGLETLFGELEDSVGEIDCIIGFDCALNAVEVSQRQLSSTVSALFATRRVIGFNTYGEQFRALHVNQTFSGLAIGV